MSGRDGSAPRIIGPPVAPTPISGDRQRETLAPARRYGTITVVGGGCYGAYYVRQLGRARDAGALDWQRLVVVDRDPGCRVALEGAPAGPDIVVGAWQEYFSGYFAGLARDEEAGTSDALVPSPLMPHLLFDWLVSRAQGRYPGRPVGIRSLAATPDVPWQRASPGGETHYVSFAEWMCPINCIEPRRCPETRGVRSWTMPAALAAQVTAERRAGHNVDGPYVFHCTHRAFGVGMVDVQDVLAADRAIAAIADERQASFLVGTVSHCHGAIGILSIGS